MVAATELIKPSDFKGGKPTWCPGCGDYGLQSAMRKALSNLGYSPEEVVIVSGIGCSGNFPHFQSTYGFHSTHGRALPLATGVALANPDVKVIAVGGDGDGYGIGVGHFIHAARRNLDITYAVMDNQIYGLTLGQASPTSQMKAITLTTPKGVDERPINPISLAIGAGASFVARGFSGEGAHLEKLLEAAIEHKGFSLVDTLSPCVTFNRLNTYDWFRDRVYFLEEEEGYNKADLSQAFVKSLEWNEKIPLGIIFEDEGASLQDLDRIISKGINPVKQKLGIDPAVTDIKKIFSEFK